MSNTASGSVASKYLRRASVTRLCFTSTVMGGSPSRSPSRSTPAASVVVQVVTQEHAGHTAESKVTAVLVLAAFSDQARSLLKLACVEARSMSSSSCAARSASFSATVCDHRRNLLLI